MITVCEEVFLLALDYDTGRASARLPERSPYTALRGALLMDLAFADRIDTDLDGLLCRGPCTDRGTRSRRALASIVDDGGRRPIDRWVVVFAEDYESVRSMLIEKLAARGIVLRGRDDALPVLVRTTIETRAASG